MHRLTLVLAAVAVVALVAVLSTDTEARRTSADPVIAYVDRVSYGDSRLKVMDANGSNQTEILRVTTSPYIYQPCWSPDGKTIVFSDGTNLWTIDVKLVWGRPRGRNLTQLTDFDDDRHPKYPRWSPDGDRIMYGVHNGLRRIEAVPAEGGDVTILWQENIRAKRYPDYATWSPDGSLIAFFVARMGSAKSHIMRVVDVDTGEAVTKIVYEVGGPEPIQFKWARTQDLLACSFWDSDTESWSLGTLDPDTGDLELLVTGATNPMVSCWSPDDGLLLYHHVVNDPDGPDTDDIRTYDLATGDVETLCTRGFDPDWAR